jgi:S-(hydroxymethyl)glutathione dehydrogenase/alcohol dehydrogenase
VIYEPGADWQIEEFELGEPGPGQLMIKYVASGLCHSDEHVRDGTLEVRLPMVGGHEGAGIVEKIGPGVSRVAVGDHVVCSFLPSCGHCRWCATGQQQICDLGARLLEGCMPDGQFVFSKDGTDFGAMCMIGTFAERALIPEASAVKVDEDLPLEKAALVGCGVPTGIGSATNTAKVEPGDTVIIYGIGGIGINSVQGAKIAGAMNIIAVDPLAYKRERAEEFGATHTFEDAESAMNTAMELTRGVGADKAIVTVDIVTPELVGAAFMTIRKGGDIVLTGLSKLDGLTVALPGAVMTLFRKSVKGSLFGDSNPTYDIPKILNLYRGGQIKLDELITNTYTLEEINQGYQDMRDGKNIRGMIIHEAA